VLCQRPRPRSESPRTRPRDVTEARFLEAKVRGMRPRRRPESLQTRLIGIKEGIFLEADAEIREPEHNAEDESDEC